MFLYVFACVIWIVTGFIWAVNMFSICFIGLNSNQPSTGKSKAVRITYNTNHKTTKKTTIRIIKLLFLYADNLILVKATFFS